MAAQGAVSAMAELLFHARTRGAGAGDFDQRGSDAQLPPPERRQVQARNMDIAPQILGPERITVYKRANHRAMFVLKQCHRAFARARMIPD